VIAVSDGTDDGKRPLVLWAIFCLVVFGAPPGFVRKHLRGKRQLRRFAKRCGAYEGRVVKRETGAGVAGRDPCWEWVVSLRPGDVATVTAEIARAVQDAGYDWRMSVVRGMRRSFFGGTSRPTFWVTVVPAYEALDSLAQHLRFQRLQPPFVPAGFTGLFWHFSECEAPPTRTA
jgi:hypothetical protein